jgi:4-hydroxy-tetrahydrodipicolinate reductase
MNTITLRKKLHNFIDEAEQEKLEAIYVILKNDIETDSLLTLAQKNELDLRLEEYLNKKGKLQNNKVNLFITRKGKTIGEHSVINNNKIENIELKHTAFSRKLFADGALNAAIWISKKNKGLFNMQDMFNLK